MKTRLTKVAIVLAIALAAGTSAFADKPESQAGNVAQNDSREHGERSSARNGGNENNVYFNEHRRNQIRNYYSKGQKPADCPPGLAKKNNCCQPPGQSRKWRKGQPLPRNVAYYNLPATLIDELGRTPEGEKIVQVDWDFLLISVATGMVIDGFDIHE
jgi:Ni/Co efflux regulator RcnB